MSIPEAKNVAFGPRKIGKQAFADQEAEEKLATSSGVVFGVRKGNVAAAPVTPEAPDPNSDDAKEPAPPADPATPAPGADNTEMNPEKKPAANPFIEGDGLVSISKLSSLLEENPGQFDLAFSAEMAQGQPRVGATKLLLKLEKATPSPRTTVLKVLQGHLEKE